MKRQFGVKCKTLGVRYVVPVCGLLYETLKNMKNIHITLSTRLYCGSNFVDGGCRLQTVDL
jgi:hypothetical protein